MIDVVWPVRPTEFNELKYSVRSAKANFSSLRKAWYLSDEEIDCEAEWIPCTDRGSHADERIINKILHACTLDCISDQFVYCCDDMYFLQDISEEELARPIAHGLLNPKPERFKHKWKKKLHETLAGLRDKGYPHYNYSTHVPYIIDKKAFLKSVLLLGTDNQICSMYFNTLHKQPEEFLIDTKLRAGFYKPCDKETMLRMLEGKVFLNHDNRGLTEHLKAFILERFSE